MNQPNDPLAISNLKKDEGNKAFNELKFDLSIKLYSEAIELNSKNHIYYSNRAEAYLKIYEWKKAKEDAEKCIELAPNFKKGYLRYLKAESKEAEDGCFDYCYNSIVDQDDPKKLNTSYLSIRRRIEYESHLNDSNDLMEPENIICGFCYIPLEKSLKCTYCEQRYCSKECQTFDWKDGFHKQYCQKISVLGNDLMLANIPNKGMGLVTNRSIKMGDKFFVERCALYILSSSRVRDDKDFVLENHSNPNIQRAIMRLTPSYGTLKDKYLKNSYGQTKFNDSTNDTSGGLFITCSRINHSCLPNCEWKYDNLRNELRLIALTDIQANEEITIRYYPIMNTSSRRRFSYWNYHFECQCAACTNPFFEKEYEFKVYMKEYLQQSKQRNDSQNEFILIADIYMKNCLKFRDLYESMIYDLEMILHLTVEFNISNEIKMKYYQMYTNYKKFINL